MMGFFISKKFIFLAISMGMLGFTVNAKAVSFGDQVDFNVDEHFDVSERTQVQALLVRNEPNIYFYAEKSWWDEQVPARKTEVLSYLDGLSSEFDLKIHPQLTALFGSEWSPGVDGDKKITILFHSMKEGTGGYFRSADEYIKLQVPNSNEREMIYLPLSSIDNFPKLKVFLAHEFTHVITFNQKNKIQGVDEETWLNEARADFASTILGYDDIYEGSNLASRVKDFLQNSSDSLTEWKETKYDYAVNNVFMHYLVDQYSIKVLSESIKLKSVGIASINEALAKQGAEDRFDQIFTNWTIALALNNCQVSSKYCYLNQNLKNLKVSPSINFLPLSGNSSLSVTNVTKSWAGNWQKIIGGNGNLRLEFESLPGLNFSIPYLVFDKDGNYTLNFFKLDANDKGEMSVNDFGSKYTSVIIMPSLQNKISGLNGLEFTYPYTFRVSVTGSVVQDDVVVIQKLLAQIEDLKRQIAEIQTKGNNPSSYCSRINNNLYAGIQNSNEVRCLQQFLSSRGGDIYPLGFITGTFGSLTKAAVIKFQQKYKILATGFVGMLTRAKINQLLGSAL